METNASNLTKKADNDDGPKAHEASIAIQQLHLGNLTHANLYTIAAVAISIIALLC